MDLSGLYALVESDAKEVSIQLASKEHPIFKAHFPNNPILPAFVHLEIISEVFNIEILEVKRAKLSEVIVPNAIITYKKEKNTFKIFENTKQVASFTL